MDFDVTDCPAITQIAEHLEAPQSQSGLHALTPQRGSGVDICAQDIAWLKLEMHSLQLPIHRIASPGIACYLALVECNQAVLPASQPPLAQPGFRRPVDGSHQLQVGMSQTDEFRGEFWAAVRAGAQRANGRG